MRQDATLRKVEVIGEAVKISEHRYASTSSKSASVACAKA
jgi:hypothetical protein